MLLEFKSYTEVSMLKRVYLDAKIAKKFIPDVKYYLCMLESAFGTFDKEDKKKASKDIAYQKGATKKGLYSILDKVIKVGSKIAINISEKI